MMYVSDAGPPLTIAQLIEHLQKLPPQMRCTNVLTEWEPETLQHVPLDGATSHKSQSYYISTITITLESSGNPFHSLPARIQNALNAEEIYSIEEAKKALAEGRLERVPNLGKKSRAELQSWLGLR